MILKDIRFLVTQNPQREVRENVDLRIEDEKIAEISENIPAKSEAVIDCSEKAVMPGLINTHTHSPMTLLRGISDDKPLQRWLEEDIFPAEDKLNREDVYRGALLGAVEMVETGTTAFNDMYFHMDAVAEAVEEVGMRAVLSHGMVDVEGSSYSEIAEAVKAAERTREKPLVENGVAPHSVYTCSEELLIEAKKLADENGSIFHVHVSESQEENRKHRKRYGRNPVEYLDDLGLLDSNTIVAHATHLSETDIEILAERNVSVAHNPAANLKLGNGVAPVPELNKKGVNVSLGTDGAASNNSLNLFDEAKTAALLHKRNDPSRISAQEVLDMMTVNASKALNMEETGSLEEGNNADIVALDLERPDMKPLENKQQLISHLVYSFNGEVSETIVDGKLVKE